jgi:hypothetical protein
MPQPSSTVGQEPNAAARQRSGRGWPIEAGTLAVLTALAVGAYVVTDAPLYNPAWSVDPWLYTALWTNFDQTYSLFHETYYASRIPWIVPGLMLNELLDARAAALVLHGVFFFAGAACVYLLCRRFFGWIAAAVAFIGLVGSQMYFSAHRWDYQEGAVITFLAASVYFATTTTPDVRRRALSVAIGGFFAAALVATQIYALIFLVGLPALYAVVLVEADSAARLRRLTGDALAFVAGAGVLLVACGTFAEAHGGRFIFFWPQVETALHTDTSGNRQPIDVWLPREPRFFVPLFVTVLAAAVISARALEGRPQRALAAATVWTGGVFVLLCVWDFLGNGFFFVYIWYVSPFLVGMSVCMAGVTAGLVQTADRPGRHSSLVLVSATAAVLAPLLWLFRGDDVRRFADDVGYEQYVVMSAVMALALVAAGIAIAIARGRTIAGLVAVTLSLLAVSYGLDASLGTYLDGASDPITGDVYDLGQDLIQHLHDEGMGEGAVNFWYDQTSMQSVPRGVQSLYYFSFTYVGVSMPKMDADFRNRMKLYRPQRLVLLCEAPGCGNGPAALREAGFDPQRQSRKRLHAGSLTMWVETYRVKSKD